jgi:hypothetical protein
MDKRAERRFPRPPESSIATSQQGQPTAIGDKTGWLVTTTGASAGAGTPILYDTGGTALGQFSDALYESLGPDGLLYVLDYGNGRVQSPDPADGFAPVGEFNLESGVTTANMQFAISNTGVFYFGDGEGGGSSYAPDGTYLGSFSSPVTGTGILGQQPYISADGDGDIFVFDSTGSHEFTDVSSAPEPSTISLMLTGIAGAAIYRRRRAAIHRPGRPARTMGSAPPAASKLPDLSCSGSFPR